MQIQLLLSLSPFHTHKHNDKQMSSLCVVLFCSYPPCRSNHAESQRGFAAKGKMHTFYLQFALAGYGQSIAQPPCIIRYKLHVAAWEGVASNTHIGTHGKKNCTTHLRRFACHTDLLKHSDAFHFAGFGFRMYHADRHTAYPEYCLSVSHSVSFLVSLILFIVFFSSTYNRRYPSKNSHF